MIAIRHRGERAVKRQDFQPVARQIEFANDLRSEQRHDIGTYGKLETRKDFLGAGRAADDVAPLKHQNLLPGFRQVSRVDKPVVAPAKVVR